MPIRKKNSIGLENSMEEGDASVNSSTAEKDKRFTKETIARRSRCRCSTCDILYSNLSDQLKCAQENIQRCKADTNKILYKVERLEAYFQ